MKLLLTFDNVQFEQSSEQSVRVRLGEKFMINILDSIDGARIATIEDPVLAVEKSTMSSLMTVEATSLGVSEVQVQDAARGVSFWITIEVYSTEAGTLSIPEPVIVQQ